MLFAIVVGAALIMVIAAWSVRHRRSAAQHRVWWLGLLALPILNAAILEAYRHFEYRHSGKPLVLTIAAAEFLVLVLIARLDEPAHPTRALTAAGKAAAALLGTAALTYFWFLTVFITYVIINGPGE